MKLEWELLDENYSPAGTRPDGFTYRATVPGGWLVAVWAGKWEEHQFGGGLTFIPDPAHGWSIGKRMRSA